MPRFIEVSHAVRPGMTTYPGLPTPEMETVWSYEESHERYEGEAEFYIASLHLCGNTGTYIDAPIHRFRQGADLAAYPLEKLAHLQTVVVDVSDSASPGVAADTIRDMELRDRAILFLTGWSRHWGTEEYFGQNPFLERATCEALRDAGARFVGIDSLNIDDTADKARPAHTVLLGAGIPVCEHMTNLEAVPAGGGRLHAVPIAWVGGASFPVRAYVMTE
jgi:kynurenine formamidase